MKTESDARQLATWLVGIAERNGVRTEALLTAMDVPLGRAIGNANEVVESIETLKGRGPRDVQDLSVRLAARMLVLAGRARDESDAEAQVDRALSSGAGLEKFRDIVAEQGGDPKVIDDYGRLPAAVHREDWRAPRAGIVSRLDAELIGRAAVALGAGRDRADAGVDPSAGIDITAPLGSEVRAGEPVLSLACGDQARVAAARLLIDEAIEIGDEAPTASRLIIDRISGGSAT